MLDDSQGSHNGSEMPAGADAAGLVFVSDCDPGISRRKRTKLFSYTRPNGGTVKDLATLARIQQLAIPPAWTEVWICSHPNGHVQATGRDARGRKQYRYHAEWSRVRDASKYDSLLSFVRSLPQLRKTIRAHMSTRGINQTRVLATVVHLLDATLIRVGNREYARSNKSFGLTTLQDQHVACVGSDVRFRFRGKTGKEWRLKVTDRRIARIIKTCQDLPGQHLFQYEGDDGLVRQVTSADVNAYLREIAGPAVSAKIFRTWNGTVIASAALRVLGRAATETEAKRNIRRAIEVVASRLGNTVSICRKCYVHPAVIEAYLDPERADFFAERSRTRKRAGLSEDETDVLTLLSTNARQNSKRRRRAAKKRV